MYKRQDHCGSIDFILDKYPNCKFVGNQKTIKFFHQFYPNDKYNEDRFLEIKDGDELNICLLYTSYNSGKTFLYFFFENIPTIPLIYLPYIHIQNYL